MLPEWRPVQVVDGPKYLEQLNQMGAVLRTRPALQPRPFAGLFKAGLEMAVAEGVRRMRDAEVALRNIECMCLVGVKIAVRSGKLHQASAHS